ncbi:MULTISPECIES: type II secretion system inner membrane protein GspF [unclassified Psychrobacter]|uniref:type II secretion system inner membrane protein GspF n=1 Tax=unclassified Psychrobacter TaxID=196806 RepID=UPI0018F54C1A|nr:MULTISPECIES: type II secretion system inner membrane protein GspF [unclassified Psychrobacter]
MPAYHYKALDDLGALKKGLLEGDSARQVRQQLRDKQWTPIEVAPVAEKGSKDRRFKKPSAYELALLTRQLSVLLASGIPLEESLAAVAKQSTKPHIQSLMLAVRGHVLEGMSLARSMQQASSFPPLYTATIAAGEKSGHLDLILNQLADYTENRFALQKKIQSAMVYPIVLMVIAAAVIIGLMSFVVPKIVKVFEQSEQALPWITQVVMGLSQLITHWWWLLLLLLALVVIVVHRFVRTSAGKLMVDSTVLKLPILARLSKGLNAARFASTLAILVRSGVPLIEALHIGAAVTTNLHIQQAITHAADRVTEGASLSSQLEKSPYFPPMMVQMIKSGENSGELEDMLSRAAVMQESEATNFISTLLSLLEPLMLVLMGAVVMVIVMAVMLPIVNMNDLAG